MKMNNIFKWGFFAAVAAIIVILMLRGGTQGDKLYIDQLHSRIESLEGDIVLLSSENDSLSGNILVLTDSLASLEQETVQLEKKRKVIIRQYEKYIKSIGTLTAPELTEFFSKRYGLSGGTTEEGSN